MGIDIGRIRSKVELTKNEPIVELALDPQAEITADSVAEAVSKHMVVGKYMKYSWAEKASLSTCTLLQHRLLQILEQMGRRNADNVRLFAVLHMRTLDGTEYTWNVRRRAWGLDDEGPDLLFRMDSLDMQVRQAYGYEDAEKIYLELV